MRACVLAAGDIEPTAALVGAARSSDLVIAADGGLRHAASLGVRPVLVVGDFDSVGAPVLAAYPDVQKRAHPRDKDRLDLELAIDEARALGATELLLVGALGGRLDHGFAAAFLALRLVREGLRTDLHSGSRRLHALAAPQERVLATRPGERFGLIALPGGAVVTLRGARYELESAELPFGSGLGVSNEATTVELRVGCEDGALFVTFG